jgi:predicted RNase H-like nuclease (RuvC/YqgF family)
MLKLGLKPRRNNTENRIFNIMDIVITALVSLITTFIGFWFGSRKSNAETDRIVIENVKEILSVYSGTINDLKDEVRQLRDKIVEYEKQIDKLNKELQEFRKQMGK